MQYPSLMIRTLLVATLFSMSLAQSVIFPDIQGENLNGETYAMPQDFEGELNLILIAFTQGQQTQIDTWLAHAETLELDALRVYEVPVLGSSYRLLRSIIDGGMRSGIDDPVARARTITFYGNKPALMDALSLPNEKTIYAVLVRSNGEVLWQAQGEANQENAASLDAYLNKATLPTNYDGGL